MEAENHAVAAAASDAAASDAAASAGCSSSVGPQKRKHDQIASPSAFMQKNEEASTPRIDDIITEDGVICFILSKLTPREAVRTCVLCPRWRHIWTHLPKLNFGAKTMFDAHTVSLIDQATSPLSLNERLAELEGKTDLFVELVDFVMHRHQSCDGVDEFVVRYFLRKNHLNHLDAWIRFALSSKTKVLVLHLNRPNHTGFEGEKYEFHFPPLGSSSLEELNLVCCSLKVPCNFNGLSHLKILKFHNVDVTDEDITSLLTNCYSLEFLWLEGAQNVETLIIPHSHSQLRELTVKYCYNCREIMINAVNLNKLYYNGYPAYFTFGQASQLKDAYILFNIIKELRQPQPSLDYYLSKVSSSMPYLHYLCFTIEDIFEVPDTPKGYNSFNHLTRLEWCWHAGVMMSLDHLATLLYACPFLEDLTLHLLTECTVEEPPRRLESLKETLPKNVHSCLKRIEMKDFCSDKWHVEFVLFLFKNAAKLESMTVRKGPKELDEEHMENLIEEVPANVKFVIL